MNAGRRPGKGKERGNRKDTRPERSKQDRPAGEVFEEKEDV